MCKATCSTTENVHTSHYYFCQSEYHCPLASCISILPLCTAVAPLVRMLSQPHSDLLLPSPFKNLQEYCYCSHWQGKNGRASMAGRLLTARPPASTRRLSWCFDCACTLEAYEMPELKQMQDSHAGGGTTPELPYHSNPGSNYSCGNPRSSK